jgi:hypothetical protein
VTAGSNRAGTNRGRRGQPHTPGRARRARNPLHRTPGGSPTRMTNPRPSYRTISRAVVPACVTALVTSSDATSIASSRSASSSQSWQASRTNQRARRGEATCRSRSRRRATTVGRRVSSTGALKAARPARSSAITRHVGAACCGWTASCRLPSEPARALLVTPRITAPPECRPVSRESGIPRRDAIPSTAGRDQAGGADQARPNHHHKPTPQDQAEIEGSYLGVGLRPDGDHGRGPRGSRGRPPPPPFPGPSSGSARSGPTQIHTLPPTLTRRPALGTCPVTTPVWADRSGPASTASTPASNARS